MWDDPTTAAGLPRSALRRSLRRTRYELVFAESAAVALALLESEPADIVLAIRRGDIERLLTKSWDDLELEVALDMAAEKAQAESENRRMLASNRAHDAAAGRGAPGGRRRDT